METIVHHLGLALGGRPAAAFANRLMMPVSNDTLLRVLQLPRGKKVNAVMMDTIGEARELFAMRFSEVRLDQIAPKFPVSVSVHRSHNFDVLCLLP